MATKVTQPQFEIGVRVYNERGSWVELHRYEAARSAYYHVYGFTYWAGN